MESKGGINNLREELKKRQSAMAIGEKQAGGGGSARPVVVGEVERTQAVFVRRTTPCCCYLLLWRPMTDLKNLWYCFFLCCRFVMGMK
jgi:hypothetical protein